MKTLFGCPIVYDNDEALPILDEFSIETTLEFGSPFEYEHISIFNDEGELGSLALFKLRSYIPRDKYKDLLRVLKHGDDVPEWAYDYVVLAFKDLYRKEILFRKFDLEGD